MGSWELSLSRVWFLSLRSDFELLGTSKEEENAYLESKKEMTSFWKSFQKTHKNAPYFCALARRIGAPNSKGHFRKGKSVPYFCALGRRIRAPKWDKKCNVLVPFRRLVSTVPKCRIQGRRKTTAYSAP